MRQSPRALDTGRAQNAAELAVPVAPLSLHESAGGRIDCSRAVELDEELLLGRPELDDAFEKGVEVSDLPDGDQRRILVE